MPRGIRGKVAVAGIGETTYYKHGQAPDSEFKLALMAILNAAEDAGIWIPRLCPHFHLHRLAEHRCAARFH